jgi:hypothetical protein
VSQRLKYPEWPSSWVAKPSRAHSDLLKPCDLTCDSRGKGVSNPVKSKPNINNTISTHSCSVVTPVIQFVYLLGNSDRKADAHGVSTRLERHEHYKLLHRWIFRQKIQAYRTFVGNAVPWLKRLLSAFSPRISGFAPVSVMWYLLNRKLHRDRFFFSSLVFTFQYHSTMAIHIHISPVRWKIGHFVAAIRRYYSLVDMNNNNIFCRETYLKPAT